MALRVSCRAVRRVWVSAVRRCAAGASEDDDGVMTSLGGSTHIPAPEVDRPKVSPLTELGTRTSVTEDTEPITSLGSQTTETLDRVEGRVVTWLGEKPEGLDEAYATAEAQRKKTEATIKAKKEYPAVEQFSFEQLPKFTRLHRPPRVQQPYPLHDALKHVIVSTRADAPLLTGRFQDESSKEHDNTVRIDIFLAVDPRKSNQFVRGLSVLPHGTGKAPRIAVFAEGSAAQEAREAEVELVGGSELIQEVLDTQGAVVERIDKCIATPAMMAAGMAKLGRILGPRGLMPNPKMGTLTDNVADAILKLRQGQIEFRVDRFGSLHAPLGKVGFGLEKLTENVLTFGSDVVQSRPALFQQKPIEEFIKKITLSSTMGRGYCVTVPAFASLLEERRI